ncbi:MAG: hypothetical protein AB1690_02320 [Candidatus Zixiibacteriota bacterium]|jgi:hypothetical protein
MLNEGVKAYLRALTALKEKDYRTGVGYLKIAQNQFDNSPDFRILKETTELLLAVKEEIFELEVESMEVKEMI